MSVSSYAGFHLDNGLVETSMCFNAERAGSQVLSTDFNRPLVLSRETAAPFTPVSAVFSADSLLEGPYKGLVTCTGRRGGAPVEGAVLEVPIVSSGFTGGVSFPAAFAGVDEVSCEASDETGDTLLRYPVLDDLAVCSDMKGAEVTRQVGGVTGVSGVAGKARGGPAAGTPEAQAEPLVQRTVGRRGPNGPSRRSDAAASGGPGGRG